MITPEHEQYVQDIRASLRAECQGRDFDGVVLVADTQSRFYRPGTMAREVYMLAAVLAAVDLGVASAHHAIAARREFEAKAQAGWLTRKLANPTPKAPITPTLDTALAEIREHVTGCGTLVAPPASLDDLLGYARVRAKRVSPGRTVREIYRLAACVVADEVGLLTAHQRIAMRKALRDVGLPTPLDQQEPVR